MTWLIKQTIDLQKGSNAGDKPQSIRPLAYPGNENAHRWEVTVLRNGLPFPLSGYAASAEFDRPDGNRVASVSHGVSDNMAWVEFPADVYTVEGMVNARLSLSKSGEDAVLAAITFRVSHKSNGPIIDPSGVITLDVAQLISAINTAVATIPPALPALQAAIAPTFSNSTPYTAGEFVWYDGVLYRFTADHAAGTWTGTDATAAVIGQDVSELKSALAYDEADINDLFERLGYVGDITTTNLINESSLTQSKMVDYSGAVVDAPNNTWYVTDLLSIGNVTELFTTYRLANMALIACYDANDTFIGIITTNSTGKERLVQNNNYWKVILYPGTSKVRMNIRSTWIGESASTRQMLTKYYYPSTYIVYGESTTSLPSTIAAKADYMYKYGIRSIGLFGNTTKYSDCDTLPVNSYVCFYGTGATGISHRPGNAFTSILEVFTVSTSDTLANGTVQIAIVRDNVNNYWAYVRSYIGSTWTVWDSLNTNEKTITVRTSGGNYTSVVDAIKFTMDNPPTKETPVVIDVGAGTFDLNDVATLVESESIDQRGLFLMPYVTLQGKGRDKTILSFEYNGSNDDVMSQVSALNIVYESALKDMKIQVKNIRYAVHADYALSTQAQDDTNTLLRDNTFIMENVELVHKGFDSGLSPTYKVPSAWGQGLRTNLIRRFINCRFEAFEAGPWFCHDRIETSKGCQLFFDGCEFIPHDNSASLRFVSWGSNLLHIVNIRNCLVRTFVSLGVVTTYNASAKINYFVKADDLDALFVEDTVNDSAKQMNYYNYRTLMCINKTNDTVTKFTPVKVLTYNNAVVNTRNGIQGIVMHNAAANEMVNVQIDGAVAIATSFTAGTRIGYSNGAWVEDQNGFLVVMNAAYCRFV